MIQLYLPSPATANAEVRRGLQPLVDLAAETPCALLGITHFTKGTVGRDPVDRLTGSLAFGALARIVLVAAKRQEEGDDGRTVRMFVRAKSNLGPDGGGFEYDLERSELKSHPGIVAFAVVWGRAVDGAARELLASAETVSDDGKRSELEEAKLFLRERLDDGPVDSNTIKADANGAGHSAATLRRAQKELGIKPRKDGMKGGWLLELPRRCISKSEDAQQKSLSTFGDFEHLRSEDRIVEVEI